MRLSPATSVTEYIMQMSRAADVRRDVSPLATVETISFGQADRQRAHRRRRERRAARAAGAEISPPRSRRVRDESARRPAPSP